MYAINIALAVIAHATMLQVAARRGLLSQPFTREQLFARAIDSLVTPVVFLLSIPVAYLTNGHIAKLCWLALVVFGPLGARFVRRVDVRFQRQPKTQQLGKDA